MGDPELVAAVRALARLAAAEGDQPWAVAWLNGHAERIEAGDARAVVELRDRLADLENSLVVEHDERAAPRLIAAIRGRIAAQPEVARDPRFRPLAEMRYTPPPPPRYALGVGILGAVVAAIGLALLVISRDCGDARSGAAIILAIVGGAGGLATLGLRLRELRVRHADDDPAGDVAIIVGIGQLLSLGITWAAVHLFGCTIGGL